MKKTKKKVDLIVFPNNAPQLSSDVSPSLEQVDNLINDSSEEEGSNEEVEESPRIRKRSKPAI